jgi:hypothetical protein
MSTAIADIEYSAKTQVLRIAFTKGDGHIYWACRHRWFWD